MKDIAILIPTLNPDIKIINLVKKLKNLDINNIVIVNDGSDKSCQKFFVELKKIGCDIQWHDVNLGKGAALKTGIKYIFKNKKNIAGIVTADGDGQHSPEDIKKVAQELKEEDEVILGSRKFDNKNMPLTSKIGNTFSSLYFKITTGQKLKDTQTGLRGIPRKYFQFALNVPGSRFEYEMRFLEAMNDNGIKYLTTDIDTIYDESWSTHFRFVSDSYSIYKKFFRNILSSLSSAVLDVIFFMILVNIIDSGNTIIISTIIARLASGAYNFTLNKIWTFEKKDSKNTRVESRRYLTLFTIQMFISGIITDLLNALFGSSRFGLLIITFNVKTFFKTFYPGRANEIIINDFSAINFQFQ